MVADRSTKKAFDSWISVHSHAPAIIRDKLERSLVREHDRRDALRLFIQEMEALKVIVDSEISNAEKWILVLDG